MRKVLTQAAMRASEVAGVAAGTPLSEMMLRAGQALAAETRRRYPTGDVLVAAGGGNNGGDGWAAARLLLAEGRPVRVLCASDPERLPRPAADAYREAVATGVPWSVSDGGPEGFRDASVIIDALLGTGSRGPARGVYAAMIDAITSAPARVVAADIPSGIDADTGDAEGSAVRAHVTVALGALKPAHVLEPGASHAGEVVLADIGLPEPGPGAAGVLECWDEEEYARLLPLPAASAHKYSRGRLVVVGGAPGMTGAACLAAGGGLRAGAGYVRIAVPAASLPVVEAKVTAPVKSGLPWDGQDPGATERAVLEAVAGADAVVAGPGLGRSPAARVALTALLEHVSAPLLLDADALYLLAEDPGALERRRRPTVLTPHAGEAARLLGSDAAAVGADRSGAATELARDGVTVVLKGPGTIVASGGRLVLNTTGGPSLATLGTGDVLAGIAGALLAQGLPPLEACALAAHLHGAAGDAAARALTPVCCTALDVIAYLPEAIRPLMGSDARPQGGPAWQI